MGRTGGLWHILGTGMQAMCRTRLGGRADSHGPWRSRPHVAIKERSKLHSEKNYQQPQFEFIQLLPQRGSYSPNSSHVPARYCSVPCSGFLLKQPIFLIDYRAPKLGFVHKNCLIFVFLAYIIFLSTFLF